MKAKDEDLRAECSSDLIKSGVRGKFAKQYREEGTNLVLIDSDLHERFPDSEAVNRAIREFFKTHDEPAT